MTTLPPYFVIATEERDAPSFNYLRFLKFYEHIPLHIGTSVPMTSYVPTSEPARTPFLAGGVLFGHGKICEELKYDPYFYFHGEEFSSNMRLWTMGYDNFSPRFCFCYHAYRSRQIHQTDTIAVNDPERDMFLHRRSIERYQVLLGIKQAHQVLTSSIVELEKYGLGDIRTVASWEQNFGMDLKNQATAFHA